MLIINVFYTLSIFLPVMSLIFLITSIKKKDIIIYKNIKIISIVYIVYMFINSSILPSILYLELGLETILLLPLQIIAVIFYIISIIICGKKIKNIDQNNIKSSKISSISIGMILIPVIILIIVILKEFILINNSDLILVYDDSGNGGFGDGKTLVYTINQNYCKEVSIGADFRGYKIENFFVKSYKNLKECEYKVDYTAINSNKKYTLQSLIREDANSNEINRAEFEYVILDIKKTYNNLNQVYISYLNGSNYYIIESRDLDSVFIYEGQKCIHKINLFGNIEIEEAFIFQ